MSTKKSKPPPKASDYVSPKEGDAPPMWMVMLRSSWEPDHYMQVWFADEGQARKIPRGAVNVETLFDILAPLDVTFTVGTIQQQKLLIRYNEYTDKPEWMNAWAVTFETPVTTGAESIVLYYPTSTEAYEWSFGVPYGAASFISSFSPPEYRSPPLAVVPPPPPPPQQPPLPPATPILSAQGSVGAVTLSWNPVNVGVLYTIWAGTASGAESANPLVSLIPGNTFTDYDVTDGVTYYYVIAAFGSGGESAESNEASATPLFPVPQAPTWGPYSGGSGGVSLSWVPDPLGGVQTFTLYRGTSSGGESQIASGLTSPVYADTSVTAETTYYYLVTGTNESGTSAYSTEINVTCSAPAPPTGLTATPGDNSVALAWTGDANANVQTYSVYRGTASGQETLLTRNVVVQSSTDNTAQNHVQYFYYVTGNDPAGESGPSLEVSVVPGAPYPPSDVAISVATTSVALSWTADPMGGDQTFSVYRGTESGQETLLDSGGTATDYLDADVTDGTTYFYYVTATNSVGESDPSEEVYGTPEPNPPTAPTGLAATPGDNSVSLEWTASPTATTYNVLRGDTSGGETVLESGLSSTHYTDETVTNGQTYYYEVEGVNDGGTGQPSAEVDATPGAPAAPSGVNTQSGVGWIRIGWDATPNTATYNVYRGTTSGEESDTPIGDGITLLAYLDLAVTQGVTFYYVVTAVNTVGSSPHSEEVSGASLGLTPNPPTVIAAVPSSEQVALSWNIPEGAEFYFLYRRTSPTGTITGIGPIEESAYTDTGLNNGTTYYYEIASVNTYGEGPLSVQVSATPGPPDAPTSLTATPGETSIDLSWDESTSDVTFDVYRGTTSSTTTMVKVGTSDTTSYTDSGLSNQTTYYYMVKAVQEGALSPPSNVASATTTGPPLAPSKLTGVAASPFTAIKLTWGAAKGAATYNVYRSTSPFTTLPTALETGITTLTYTDSSSLTRAKTYYYRVAGVNTYGTGAASNQESVVNGSPEAPVLTLSQPNSPRGNFSLSWTIPTGATSFRLTREAFGSYAALSANVTLNGYAGMANLLDYDLLPPLTAAGAKLVYYCQAVDAFGAGPSSNTVSVDWFPYCGIVQAKVNGYPTSYTFSATTLDVYNGSGLVTSGHPSVTYPASTPVVNGVALHGNGWIYWHSPSGYSVVTIVYIDFTDLDATAGGFLAECAPSSGGVIQIYSYPSGQAVTYETETYGSI